MRLTISYLLAISLASAAWSGCFIIFPPDDDCQFGGDRKPQPGEAAPALGLRNPETGECQYFGGGGGGPICDDACGPCPTDPSPVPAPAPLPSWGFCQSECSYLDEGTCLNAAGCRGVYNADGQYAECWAVDQTGPVQGEACSGLDAWECSRHDDCIAVHETCNSSSDAEEPGFVCDIGGFIACGNEPDSEPGLCYGEVLCDEPPPGCPPNSIPGRADGCWTGQCIAVEDCEDLPPPACVDVSAENECISRPECTPLYQGEDCTCGPMGCACNQWVFTGCE